MPNLMASLWQRTLGALFEPDMEGLASDSQTCCICLEEKQIVLQIFPCLHNNVCSSCIYRLDDMKCPTCRQKVDSVGLNLKGNVKTKRCNLEDEFFLPTASIYIPLQSVLQYRRKAIRKLVASTLQVYFVGSSGISLHKIADCLVEKFGCQENSKNDMKNRELDQRGCDRSDKARNIKGFFSQLLKKDNDADSTKYLLDFFFDMNECRRYYLANAFIEQKSIRFSCFAFWEFLRILRSAGAPDAILPDVIVTCVDFCNEKCVQETMEMQDIMTKIYKQHGRTLFNIWLYTSGSQYKGKGSTKQQLEKLFGSITEAVWPRKVVVLPKQLNSKDIVTLGDIIVSECIDSRNCLLSSEISDQ